MTEGIIVWTLRSLSMLALPEEPSMRTSGSVLEWVEGV